MDSFNILGFDEKIKAADRDLQEAKSKYLQLQKEVETAVNVVKEIADEIQKQEDISRVGDIVYAGTGLFSSALFLGGLALAPFTAGFSLAATAGGAVVGAGTAVAGVTRDFFKDKIVNDGLAEATRILESISKKWEELHTLLEAVLSSLDDLDPSLLERVFDGLKKLKGVGTGAYVTGAYKAYSFYRASKALNLLRKGKIEKLQKFLCIGKFTNKALTTVGSKLGVNVIKTTRGVTKVANKVMIPLAIFGAVMDVKDIVDNSVKISNGEMNDKAKALIESADALEEEMEKLAEIFEDA